jgi:hypothetical protein
MLKQRPAGDKSWPIACSDTTLGTTDKELDLSGAHLSYGDFQDATFIGTGTIKLNGAGLAHADLSGSKLTADGGWGDSLINLTKADLTDADLSGAELTALTIGPYGTSTIDFTEATLDQADLSGTALMSSHWKMGIVTSECYGTCTCPPGQLDAHVPGGHTSVTQVSPQVVVRKVQDGAAVGCGCVVRLTVSNHSRSGGYDFKVIALFAGLGELTHYDKVMLKSGLARVTR